MLIAAVKGAVCKTVVLPAMGEFWILGCPVARVEDDDAGVVDEGLSVTIER